MTRNHETQPIENERYVHAATAARLAKVMAQAKQSPIVWAQEICRLQSVGEMRPRKEMADKKDEAKLRASTKPDLIGAAMKAIIRGENEQRVRSMIRAIRMLNGSKEAADHKLSATLSTFLRQVWGIERAYETVAEGEVDDMKQLREEWGDVQLPPADAKVGSWVADELLIAAAVRRLK